ncbi:hypothetical protein IWW48_006349, partial [Coemansia sp. RSA 1200]
MPGMYWANTHNKLIERADGRKRKPDDCFLADHSAGLLWQNVAIAVEIKGDSMDGGHDLIWGQLLQDFINMTEILPRRFMIGLTLGRGSEVHLYVCVPSGIHIVSFSKLPLLHGTRLLPNRTGSIADKILVVKFLLFLHQQFAIDCGYLTGCDSTFPCDFRLSDILGVLQNKNIMLRPSTTIRINCAYDDANSVLGRHNYLKGQQTWAYPAQYFHAKRDRPRNAFFKFQWAFEDEPEISVHQFVLDNGVPHVLKLLYTANIESMGCDSNNQGFKGEAIVMEDVGISIKNSFYEDGLNMSEAKIIDIFVGYAHTLIAAAKVNNRRFVLHRDVSTGNLMVGHDGSPYVIDWGCGRVCTVYEQPRLAGKQMVGTAIYMGIRILTNCKTRL